MEWLCHFLLQGIFPIQGLNPSLLYWQVDSLPLSHQESSYFPLLSNNTSTTSKSSNRGIFPINSMVNPHNKAVSLKNRIWSLRLHMTEIWPTVSIATSLEVKPQPRNSRPRMVRTWSMIPASLRFIFTSDLHCHKAFLLWVLKSIYIINYSSRNINSAPAIPERQKWHIFICDESKLKLM